MCVYNYTRDTHTHGGPRACALNSHGSEAHVYIYLPVKWVTDLLPNHTESPTSSTSGGVSGGEGGATIEELILPDTLKSVGIRSHNCNDPIEKVYYSAYKDNLICIHCGSPSNLTVPNDSETFYPYCSDCSSLDRIHRRQQSL